MIRTSSGTTVARVGFVVSSASARIVDLVWSFSRIPKQMLMHLEKISWIQCLKVLVTRNVRLQSLLTVRRYLSVARGCIRRIDGVGKVANS